MSKVNKNIESVKKLVSESVSSVFSKEDVIKLIKRIEDTDTDTYEVTDKIEVSREWLVEMIEGIRDTINSEMNMLDADDIVDFDDIELRLEGREIFINTNSIYLDASSITDKVSNELDGLIDEINAL